MTKLLKITSDYYRTQDKEYELKKDFVLHGVRIHRVWKMYKNGEYIGQPETLAMAKQWIEARKAGREDGKN